jgi:uncharacterized membrane protein SpoIIM required for sporulation
MSDARHNQALSTALLKRADQWQEAMERARRLADHRTDDIAQATRAVEDYRLLARDLASARRLIPNSRAREYLEAAYAQSHATLHRPVSHPLYAAWSLFRDQVPEVMSWLRPHLIWVTLLFILSILGGHWMVRAYPDLIALFASPDLIATVERGRIWTEGLLNVVPSSVLSARVLTNNIVVSLTAFCAGCLFGIGTFYMVALNGLMLGAIFAFTAQHGLDDELFRFIIAHGPVELSVMCLSGAAGAAVGESLIRPSAATRRQSFQWAALRAGKLLFVCVLLLIGCGLIEGYISPDPDFPLWTCVSIGLGYWVFMVAVLRGWLFGRGRSRQPIAT